ncbi:MAG: 16S rRNA (uracil(1498)-N(3))-methyltransferase [Caldilineaceae bacterium]
MNSYHRFFLSNHHLQLQQTIDLSAIGHQLQRVLRLQPGTQIVLLDGAGRAFVAEIVTLSPKVALGRILAQLPNPPEPTVQLTLYQCSLKADKFEWVLQKGTELGVSRFVPVISQRSIVRPASALLKKYERWQAIISEAAEQCGRGRLPELAQPLTWPNAITYAQGIRLLPWEVQNTTLVTIRAALTAFQTDTLPNSQPINLLIGPEGGISEDEAAAAQAAGWQAVSLGPRILRAETAALAGIVLAMEHTRQLQS